MVDLRVISILEPTGDDDETVALDYYERLCHASGRATGSQVSSVWVYCEPLENKTDPITMDAEDANLFGKLAREGAGEWVVEEIEGSHEGYNALIVGVFYYGYEDRDPLTETVVFHAEATGCEFTRGTRGSLARLLAQRIQQSDDSTKKSSRQSGQATQVSRLANQLFDLIDTWWWRDVNDPRLIREPSERDGDWMLYRGIPVDLFSGQILGLNGEILNANKISLAVESIEIRRKLKSPFVHLAVPTGTGEVAPPAPQPGSFERVVSIAADEEVEEGVGAVEGSWVDCENTKGDVVAIFQCREVTGDPDEFATQIRLEESDNKIDVSDIPDADGTITREDQLVSITAANRTKRYVRAVAEAGFVGGTDPKHGIACVIKFPTTPPHSLVRWQFPGFSQFAVIVHQHGTTIDPRQELTQVLTSTSRENPTRMYVSQNSPIHIAINTPRTEEWLNEGHIDLWVRVDE